MATLRQRLSIAGIESAREESEWILGDLLGCSRTDLYTAPDRVLNTAQWLCLEDRLRRREQREPLQYILGKTEFYGHEFDLSPGVLIPRPETEVVVERALEFVPRADDHLVLDVGTGSGAIGLTIALERPRARVYAVDLSPVALEVAGKNAIRHGAHLVCTRADLADLPFRSSKFDLIVSNPPYVADAALEGLAPEIRCHEPTLALSAGPVGRASYERLGPEARRILKPGGRLVLELPGIRTNRVEETIRPHLPIVSGFNDLAGRPRVLVGQKPT